ncbi:hypothetical protein TNIN_421921 [Trichonephila inaurata madagascariensis]|uniref:Uncharacterized protein n=1 Tax=Trichonephila inaurata madagascariensis TaxID=2747483 RepID=A0A8X6YXT1_9ARAC|nr:hypothetical protein TNIN_421921 [Trichonephila inaurata madagascariensis]
MSARGLRSSRDGDAAARIVFPSRGPLMIRGPESQWQTIDSCPTYKRTASSRVLLRRGETGCPGWGVPSSSTSSFTRVGRWQHWPLSHTGSLPRRRATTLAKDSPSWTNRAVCPPSHLGCPDPDPTTTGRAPREAARL